MKMQVIRTFTFDAAHYLTKYHGKCERLHGHTYILTITLEGPIKKDGLVIDFVLLKKIVDDEILNKLDHQDLNTIFENPSAELIAQWIWNRLKNIAGLTKRRGLKLIEVKLCETPSTCVILKL